jgi:pyruvate,water dikinase
MINWGGEGPVEGAMNIGSVSPGRDRDRYETRVGADRSAVDRSAPVLASGKAVGETTVTGVARFVSSASDLAAFKPGEIFLADAAGPEWRSVIETAVALVTNKGDDACEAAVMARALGLPAVVGTIDGASRLWSGATLTIRCAADGVGRVYEGVPDGALAAETL